MSNGSSTNNPAIGEWVGIPQTPDECRKLLENPDIAVCIIIGVDGTIRAYPMDGTQPHPDPVPVDAMELAKDEIVVRVTQYNPKCTTTTIGGQTVTVCK